MSPYGTWLVVRNGPDFFVKTPTGSVYAPETGGPSGWGAARWGRASDVAVSEHGTSEGAEREASDLQAASDVLES